MIHTIRTVAVGDQESKIDSPIILYRGDREIEVEFTINGSKFTFTNGGNVIKSTNATHGQLVINTPTGENMFSEVTECHDGKVVFVITKEMIDELIEVGFYSFQIRLFDESQVSRVTIPPVLKGIDIRNPIAAEDETNVVDIGLVDYAVVVKDEFEDLSTFLPDGNYNKTEWESKDVISGAKLNKIEDALYNINGNMEAADLSLLNRVENINKNIYGEIDKLGNELESEVEEFERELNINVETFKIDANAAMTAHKNEVSTQLADITSSLDMATIVLTPEMYGCIGDGLTDDTLNFQKCINDAVQRGAMINGLGKTYMISDAVQIPTKYAAAEYGLYVEGSLHLYNCNFVLKAGCLGKTTVINIMNQKGTRVIIDCVTIDGNGHNQSTDIGSQDGGLHGLRVGYDDYNIEIGGFEIKNSIVRDCYSDCICTRPAKFDFCHIHDCTIIMGGRNGITDNAHTSVVKNCTFIDNGWRTAPRSAYHIEPDSSFDFGTKTLQNCKFTGTAGDDYKIHFNSRTYNVDTILIDNCIMSRFSVALYCAEKSYTNRLSITNSIIPDFTMGHGVNDTSHHAIKEIYINNVRGDLLSLKGPDEEAINVTAENSSFKTIHFAKGIKFASFDKCIFYREVNENVDATRNNCIYFDYSVSGDGRTTELFSLTNCSFYNINRCIMLGTYRNFNNVILKNNLFNTTHLILSQSQSVNNLLIDGNVFKDITGNPGTAGKFRVGEQVKNMMVVNNIFYMSETAAYGNYTQLNMLKANNIFNATE